MKILKYSIVSLIIISAIIALGISQIPNFLKYYKFKNAEKIEEINDIVSIYKSSRFENKNVDVKEIEYIKLAIPIVDDYLGLTKNKKFRILIDLGDCSGVTNPQSKYIVLNDCEQSYLPFVHEYLHLIFGVYNELWFSEGFATYLSLRITSESELKNFNDQNTSYFFDAWSKDVNSNIDWNSRNELSYIDDLKTKYTQEEVRSIISLKNEISFYSLDNPHEFYRLSSSFCEFLSTRIGENRILDLARKSQSFNNSILETASFENINIEELFKEWLISFN